MRTTTARLRRILSQPQDAPTADTPAMRDGMALLGLISLLLTISGLLKK
jgi:hypothetical protein